MPRTELTEARRVRTKAANELRRLIHHNLTSPAEWNERGERVGPEYVGLPSWWPFWSDVVYRHTRELVRLARKVAELEAPEVGAGPAPRPDLGDEGWSRD